MSDEAIVKVAIAEDNDEFRLTLRDIISFESGLDVVALWKNGNEVLAQINETKPDVMLMDVRMPGMNGIDTLRHLQEMKCRTKVVMLTMHDDEEILLKSLQYGASSYLVKDGSVDTILRAVREVAAGRAVVHPQVAPFLLNRVALSQQLNESWKEILTAREYDVLVELATGKSNDQIADTLHITVKTAKNHVSHILQKLGVQDRAQAVLYAAREHWIHL